MVHSTVARDDVSVAARRAAGALAALHLIGAVAAFAAIGTYAASHSPLGRLLPAGESSGFVWLRERSAILVWIPLVWLFALALLQAAIHGTPLLGGARPGQSRRACPLLSRRAEGALAAIEMGAILAVAWAIARSWSTLLTVAHSLLQAAIMLQFLAAARVEPPRAGRFLALRERHHVLFLTAAFVFAATPIAFDPGVRAVVSYVRLDSDFERALSRVIPPLLSGITGLWAAAESLFLLAAARAASRFLRDPSPVASALDRVPFVVAWGAAAAAFVISLAPAIAWELQALDLEGLMPPLVLLMALIGGVLSHGAFRVLSRAAPAGVPLSPVGVLALSMATLPVFPLVWWLAQPPGRASWRRILMVGFIVSTGLGAGVLYAGVFNPWFTVFSYLKWFLFKAATITAAGILVLGLNEGGNRLSTSVGDATHRARNVSRWRSRWAIVVTAASLPLTLAPFGALERYREIKAAVLEFSELTMVDANYARAVARALGVGDWIHLGQAPERADVPDPWPAPWLLERTRPSRLPRDFNLIVIVVDALRGDAFRSAGYHRDLAPFLDRWAREEAISFRRAYTHGGGTFAAFPFLIAGRSRLNLYGPGLHRENVYLKLAQAEGIRHVVAVHEFAPSALFPLDVRVVGHGRARDAGLDRSVPADEVLGWARDEIAALESGQRFFIYIHLLDVHNDLWKKADGLDLGNGPRDVYDNNVSYVDRAMARFIGWLRTRGLYDRTVIVFTSDHGEQFWEHGASLHGHTVYEEELRVPLIVLAHGLRGRVDDVPVVVADTVPTLLDLAGYVIRPPYDDPHMGISLVPLLLGADPHRYVRRDVVGRASFKRTYFLYRDWRWKLIWSADLERLQLFDLETDPDERRSLLQERPALAAALERDLLAYLARVEGRVFRPLLSR